MNSTQKKEKRKKRTKVTGRKVTGKDKRKEGTCVVKKYKKKKTKKMKVNTTKSKISDGRD